MSQDTRNKIKKLLKTYYEDGMYGHGEFICRVTNHAALPGFFDNLDLLPDKILDELKNIAFVPHPEDLFIIRSSCGPKMTEQQEMQQKERDRKAREVGYWADRLLREHFFPDAPEPEFEVLKRLGRIEERALIEDTVIIFGDDIKSRCMYIRQNPLHLVTTAGDKIVSSGRTGSFRCKEDENSNDRFRRKYGRFGVQLGPEVLTVSDVPIGTEVWVDRSAVRALPARPDPSEIIKCW